jgi:hypothetical protein
MTSKNKNGRARRPQEARRTGGTSRRDCLGCAAGIASSHPTLCRVRARADEECRPDLILVNAILRRAQQSTGAAAAQASGKRRNPEAVAIEVFDLSDVATPSSAARSDAYVYDY